MAAAMTLTVWVGSIHAQVSAACRYDALGRRIEKAEPADGRVVRWFYANDQVCEEQDEAAGTVGTLVFGQAVDEVLAMRRDGLEHFLHDDALHSVVVASDVTGATVERYGYGAFGGLTVRDANDQAIAASAIGNPYGFNGRRYDPESKLYHYRTRYMDPTTGRFLQRDRLGTWRDSHGAGNGRTYVANNPWSHRDPWGTYIVIEGTPDYQSKVEQQLAQLAQDDPQMKQVIDSLDKSRNKHAIEKPPKGQGNGNGPYDSRKARDGRGSGTSTAYDPDSWTRPHDPSGKRRRPRVGLAHELSHAYDADRGIRNENPGRFGLRINEERACRLENRIRKKTGDPIRKKYGPYRISNPEGDYFPSRTPKVTK